MKMLDHVVFSIDNAHDLHTLAKFTRWIDTKKALSELQQTPYVLIGKWKGRLENSFLMNSDDFNKYVIPHGWVDKQKTVMKVSADKRMSAQIMTLTGEILSKGFLKQVSPEIAHKADGFTYCPERGVYWVLA